MKQSCYKLSLIVIIFLTIGIKSNCQPVPEDFRKGTIHEQLDQLKTHTMIYQNFRAIREDIFQIVSRNVIDSLAGARKKIYNLTMKITSLNGSIDSMSKSLETTKSSLEEMTRTKNSINVLGLAINKTAYNTIMWSILAIIVLLLIIGYFIFNRNSNTMLKAKNELADLQKEFENYKQRKRIELEKMTMAHFNEVKKIKDERR